MAYTPTVLDVIQQYAEKSFPKISSSITSAQWEQISWIDDKQATSEKAVEYKPDSISIHVKRVLVRLNCLHLLKTGTEEAYQEFIEVQLEPKLEQNDFSLLSAMIRKLSEIQYTALWTATTIAMSPKTITLAQEALQRAPSPDSVMFLAEVMTQAPAIYPAAKELLAENHAEFKNLFAAMFDTAHLRHFMYQEGNMGMLRKMRKKITEKHFGEAEFNIWFAYWLIDVAGFRGHIKQAGSVYLNHNTFLALSSLRNALSQFAVRPAVSIEDMNNAFQNYLAVRTNLLGFQPGVSSDSRFFPSFDPSIAVLTKIACMMRFFTPQDGMIVKTAMQNLKSEIPLQDYDDLIDLLNPFLRSPYPTPTYLPALFQNLFDHPEFKEKGDAGKAEAIKMGLKIYLFFNKKYCEQTAPPPLNFNTVSMAISNSTNLTQTLAEALDPSATISNGTAKLGTVSGSLEKKPF